MVTIGLLLTSTLVASAASLPFANETVLETWARTDQPVAEGATVRTWVWGPAPLTTGMSEPYAESPDGQRLVQYFDKSRMEITIPTNDQGSPWYVTNGLLVVELVTGLMRIGDHVVEERGSAHLNVAGDPDDPNGVTYAALMDVIDQPAVGEGDPIDTAFVWVDGKLSWGEVDPRGVTGARYVPETGHTVAEPFWEFMNSTGLMVEHDRLTEAPLFVNPFYATGFPVTEANWAFVKVAGTFKDVLIQCFERRCLTYTPSNAPEWQVEAGNVGQHYFRWRYREPLAYEMLVFEDEKYAAEVGRLTSDIYSVRADGSQLANLTNDPYHEDFAPSWSPTGDRIAFFRADYPSVTLANLYVASADGSNLVELAEDVQAEGTPTWSPDGDRIVVARGSRIYAVESSGSGEQLVAELPGTVLGVPAWSPDGTRIAFLLQHEDQVGQPPPRPFSVAIVNGDGTGYTRIATSAGWNPRRAQPAWSADGAYIAYESVDIQLDDDLVRRQIPSVNVISLDSLASWSTVGRLPAWSPARNELSFWSTDGGLYRVRPDGSEMRLLNAEGGASSWSPDGTLVAFSGMFVVRADGSDLFQVTDGGTAPQWRPRSSAH